MFLVEKNIRSKLQTKIIDAEKSASAAHLQYVCDKQPGIRRIRTKNGFIYKQGGKLLNDTATLDRIKKLVLPPAWENVWICSHEAGHLQATGIDQKKRKQYKYHSLWNKLRSDTKFHHLYAFGKKLPLIRKRLQQHLSLPGLPPEKVLAAIVLIMEKTSIRIGSTMYEKLYGSFGITTLKDKHVKIGKSTIRFLFKGKKGIIQTMSLKSKRLSRIVKSCRDIPGKELFQYYDENGDHRSVDSGMVNNYLKQISGDDLSAKDFRTWSGSVHALMEFMKKNDCETAAEAKHSIAAVLDCVAKHLGNTRSVCKKYYVHPILISLYENNVLKKYFMGNKNNSGEKILLRILRAER